jgi:hypothetical protein
MANDLDQPLESLRPSAEELELLRSQTFDLTQPGSILHDFQVMLDAVAPGQLAVAGKHQLLPMSCLMDLNARLHCPLEVHLDRPQLRSYPNLAALYLLLRTTGLVLDAAVHNSWLGLNPAERYFTLLEAWMIYAQWDVVGEPGRERRLVLDSFLLWQSLPKTGRTIPAKDRELFWRTNTLCLLQMMDLSGLIRVESGEPTQGIGWCLKTINHLPFGDAVFALLRRHVMSGFIADDPADEPIADAPDKTGDDAGDDPGDDATVSSRRFGWLQPLFQPHVPAWRNNLVIPEPKFRAGIFVFKVSLGAVWRRIAVPATVDLEVLAMSILKAFRFDDDHLYMFTYRDRFGATAHANAPFDEEGPSASEVQVGQLPLQPGESMEYLFDFGDSWKFTIKLEKADAAAPPLRRPKVIESHGKAPAQYESWEE